MVAQSDEQPESSNRELEAFSYSISHDLRAPVRAISGYAQILERDYGGRLDAEGLRLLRIVRGEAARMNELIDDLLRYSALGYAPLQKDDVDMTQLARQAADEERPARNDGLEITIEELPRAPGDAALLRRVWSNLISNAIKYSSGRSPAVVRITGSADGREASYCIEDNGAGFNMKYYEKLFSVFQRLHHADEFPGTGIGLAIVQRIVERHGGRIWAESEPGHGAVFTFALPLTP